MPTDRLTLIIDDDPLLREALATALVQWGHSVVEVGSLAEARDAFLLYPSLVLLDVHLPDGRSIDLAAELCASPHRPTVIMMSGGTTDEEVQHLLARGVTALLAKPFTLETLRRVIGTVGVEASVRSAPP
jgi:DNA-binding response OmpR family regulator